MRGMRVEKLPTMDHKFKEAEAATCDRGPRGTWTELQLAVFDTNGKRF